MKKTLFILFALLGFAFTLTAQETATLPPEPERRTNMGVILTMRRSP